MIASCALRRMRERRLSFAERDVQRLVVWYGEESALLCPSSIENTGHRNFPTW